MSCDERGRRNGRGVRLVERAGVVAGHERPARLITWDEQVSEVEKPKQSGA